MKQYLPALTYLYRPDLRICLGYLLFGAMLGYVVGASTVSMVQQHKKNPFQTRQIIVDMGDVQFKEVCKSVPVKR